MEMIARTVTLPARADLSAWIAWVCFAAALVASGGPASAVEGAAIMLAVTGFLMAVAAIQRHMRVALSASCFGEPARLVTDGPFAISRNPIYLAFLLPMASLGAVSPVAAVLGAAAYVALTDRLVIRAEEKVLRREFGAAFDAYAARVPRWVGPRPRAVDSAAR